MLAVLALLVFGPESLPDIAKTVARTVRAFRQASSDLQNEVREALEIENKARKASTLASTSDKPDEVFEMAPRTPARVAEQTSADPEPPHPDLSEEAVIEQAPEIQNAIETIEAPVELAILKESVDLEPGLAEHVAEEDVEVDDDGPGVPMTKHTLSLPAESEPTEATA